MTDIDPLICTVIEKGANNTREEDSNLTIRKTNILVQ